MHSNINRNMTHTNTEPTHEEKMRDLTIKRMLSKKKTTLLSLGNQDWKTVKAETEKNKQIINTYLKEQHHGIK